MRSINTLQWEAGQVEPSLKAISVDNTLLIKLSKYAIKAILYLPYRFNRYLNSLDAVPNPYRNQARNVRATEQDERHRHIPSRVWQRRSALITALEEKHQASKTPESTINGVFICQAQPEAPKAACSSSSFNVVQVRSLPVWASNFPDMGLIEQELDFCSRPELVHKVV